MPIDVEGALIAYLRRETGVEAYAEVPNPRPPEFITVERTGGPRTDVVIDNPMVAIQCWSTSRLTASHLALRVDEALPPFAYEPNIHKVERLSLYNHPDEVGNVARYQIVVQLKTI